QSGRTIQGTWVIPPDASGGFTIWPQGEGCLDGEFFVQESASLGGSAPASPPELQAPVWFPR
ncbi:MAG: hypothetical protein AB1758_16325, partial [Candidatus Eremiobacterota bacterium]